MTAESYFGMPDFRVEHFFTEAALDRLRKIAMTGAAVDGWFLTQMEYRRSPQGLDGWAKWVKPFDVETS